MHTFYSSSRSFAPVIARPTFAVLVLLLALAGWSIQPPLGRSLAVAPSPPILAPRTGMGQLPLSFVPNTGQSDPQVRFQAAGLGGTLFFTSEEVVLALPQREQPTRVPDAARPANAIVSQPSERAPVVTRLRFEGANRAPHILGGQPLPGRVNYFQGDDPTRWHTNVPTYAGITYSGLYPGIDLRYDGMDGRLKGTYTLAAGADPERIRWRYDGASGARVEVATGDLLINLAGAAQPLTERAPVAWQEIDGRRVSVAARYVLDPGGTVGFALGRYDSALPLTIDPTLEYSSYLGGGASDGSRGIAVDRDGNIFLVGSTASSTFPTAGAIQPTLQSGSCGLLGAGIPCADAFVLKLNPAGTTLLYSTYIGGGNEDSATSIALDLTGNTYITGLTRSSDFPTAHPFQAVFGGSGGCPEDNYNPFNPPPCPDAFVVKLSADGSSLGYSTYLGGAGYDAGYSLAVGGDGVVSLTGRTSSSNFPTAQAFQSAYAGGTCLPLSAPSRSCYDVFVTRLSAAGDDLMYSTYLGSWWDDEGHGIAVDSAGAAYVTGMTHSNRFPTVHAFQPVHADACASDALSLCTDAFVTKLSPDGRTLSYSSFLGGGDYDSANAIAIDVAGNAYVTGETWANRFPLVNPLQPACGIEAGLCRDAFVAKVKADGSALLYSTFLGGESSDYGYSIAVDAEGNAFVGGMTYSKAFPAVHAIQSRLGAGTDNGDAFLAKLNTRGNALLMSTYLGGQSMDYGYAVALREGRDVLLTGTTCSPDFPTARAIQPTFGGACDAFLSSIAIPSTTLTNRLLDTLTGLPIARASGTVALYNGATFLASAPFTTDAAGEFTVAFSGPISQSVKLEYSAVAGYFKQYYDRGSTLGQAAGVLLHSGSNTLTTHLVPATMLENRVIDDRTGLPISLKPGAVLVYSGTTVLETAPFTTDADGIARIAFSSLISQSVRLGYSVDGYFAQFYDRALAIGQAAPVQLYSGPNSLTTRLLPATRLVNTLIDDTTGLPIGNRSGTVDVFSGTLGLENQRFITDASGVYTATFSTAINQDVALRYSIDGYARQFYDRRPLLEQADPVALHGGRNTLTSHLLPRYTLVNTLLDDPTGLPIANNSGLLTIYLGTVPIEQRGFKTDASGVYTLTLSALLNQDVRLEYSRIVGHARQFYDRAPTIDTARALGLHSGSNQLTTRLVRAPTLLNTLLDDRTSLPVSNALGIVEIYSGTLFLESQGFMTDASGVFTATLINTRVGQQAAVGYSGLTGYARQFYDRKAQPGQANPLLVRDGQSTLTTRLAAATVIVGTVLNDAIGRPVANTSGGVDVYSGTTQLDGTWFTTDASGVYTATLRSLVDQNVRLGYGVTGYPYQFYDRKLSLAQADDTHLSSGRNSLTLRLLATTLVDTLINDATGLPIRNTIGAVEVYSGTALLERREFQTDADGTYTVAFSNLFDRDVRLGYQVNGYAAQFADRKRTLAQADPIHLSNGLNIRTTRLLATTLIDTLIDDASGLPIPNLTGSVEIYSGTALLESQPFTTDSQGVFTVSLKTLLDQDVRLGYRAPGYPFQFYDRKPVLAQAQPVPLIVGRSVLTTRLKSMTLVNTLIDDTTGEPLGHTTGAIDAYAGAALIEHRSFTTDASGTYTTTFSSLIDQPIALGYTVEGYARQFYDRQRTLERANLVSLASGRTTLTTRLLPPTVLVNQLLDNISGEPVRDATGTLTLYDSVAAIESAQFRTDASGVYTVTFAQLINESTRVGYQVAGYPKQYADRKLSLDLADPIALRSGSNTLTTRLLPMPGLTVTLIDDPTGQPIPNISGWLTVHWTNGIEYVPFTTDASGVYTATFRTDSDSTVPISQGLILEYGYIPGYFDQFYDRVFTTGEATRVVLQSGPNRITTRITRPPTTLAATLMDGPYRLQSKHVHVAIERDAGPLFQQDYISDGNGDVLIEAGWLVGTDFRLRFHVEGFPDQYIGGTTRFDHANLVPLYSGPNYRTFQIARYATLINALVDDGSGAPLANIVGQLRVYTDTNSFMTFPFDTDDNGVMLLQIEGLNILDDNVRLEYEVSGYPTQFYDRKATYAEATPVLLQNGNTTFTTRLSTAVVRPAIPTPPPSPTPPPPPLPTPPPLPIDPGLISPQAGGSLRYTDTTTLFLQFPPGAVTEPVSGTVTSRPVEKVLPGTRAVGPAFDIQIRNQSGALVSQFGRPVTITVQYDPRDIVRIDEGGLFIAYWDTAAGAWVALPTQRDPEAHTLSATVDHISQIAVFGSQRWQLYLPVAARW